MRKATLIFILLVFVGSIMIVNFFGLEYKVYNKTIKVEEIQISDVVLSEGLKLKSAEMATSSNNEFYKISVAYERGYNERTNKDQVIMIIPHLIPDNATDKTVDIEHTENKAYEFKKDTPVPTIIYRDIDTTSRMEICVFTLKNKFSGKKIEVRLYTTFVDSLN